VVKIDWNLFDEGSGGFVVMIRLDQEALNHIIDPRQLVEYVRQAVLREVGHAVSKEIIRRVLEAAGLEKQGKSTTMFLRPTDIELGEDVQFVPEPTDIEIEEMTQP